MPTKKGQSKFMTPDEMWNHFTKYQFDLKRNPFIVKDWVGGAGREVRREKEKPLTQEGFENFLRDKGVIKNIGDYLTNKNGQYGEFTEVLNRIKSVIRQDQIEGGMAMIYQPSITQRLNNLVERTENKHEVNEIIIKYES